MDMCECDMHPTPIHALLSPLEELRQAHWGVLTLPVSASVASSRHSMFQQPCLALAEKLTVTWWHQLFCNWQILKSLIITNNRSTSSISYLSRQSSWVVYASEKADSSIIQKRNPELTLHLTHPVQSPYGSCRRSEVTTIQKPNSLFFWCCF